MSRIQLEPICVYWWKDNEYDHGLHFHADHDCLSFDEFCLYVILPILKRKRAEGYGVRWGYVNNGGQTIDEFESSLRDLIDACE
jgi:hypothetical protein